MYVYFFKNKKRTIGIITDGQVRRFSQKDINFKSLPVKKIMTKKPIFVDKNELAAKALSTMNNKKITALCVYKKNKRKTTGLIHVHNILNANINRFHKEDMKDYEKKFQFHSRQNELYELNPDQEPIAEIKFINYYVTNAGIREPLKDNTGNATE